MLDNTITLSVDQQHTGSTTDIVYTRFEEPLNRSVYNSEDHTYTKRDTLGFYRTLPKRAGKSLGVKKSAVKFTLDQEVPSADGTTTLISPLIVDVSMSLPVGTTPAVAMIARQRLVALMNNDAIISKLMENLEY
jgi:hypothetical protein